MDKNKTEKYKMKLLEEKTLLENELKTVGKKNPSNPADWEATIPEENIDNADRNNVADEINDYENNNAISSQLEIKLSEINNALEKVEKGKYGLCEICGNVIEDNRLDANLGAKTCKKHINEKV